jgi:hypothetical protein
MPVYIFFYHGRHAPDEELNDWGFDGPVMGPFDYVQITYGCDIKAIDEKEKLPHFTIIKDGLVEVLGAFYGDFIVIDEKTCKKSYNAGKCKTKEILAVPEKNIPLLINEKTEWVKIYVERSLKYGSNTPKSSPPCRPNNRRPGRSSRKSP